MTQKDIIMQMLSLQQELNNETNGIGWENGYTKNNKLINWKRCIYMECAELIDSFAWKHWKAIDKEADWENVKVEIVDIWHFIMSLILEEYKNNNPKSIEKIAKDIVDAKGFRPFGEQKHDKDENFYEIINDIEGIIHIVTSFKTDIFNELLTNYFYLALKCGVNLDELYFYYVAKNVLNRFRQNHGYKEGTYKKTWNGKEDNEVMVEILSSGAKSVDEIYAKLESIYKEL